ncbi:MAG: NADH-quinone oxidoreductase subunit F, partial [Mesorhizobium sp.]
MTMQQRRSPDRGPKGRALDDVALADVRELLGHRERRRDLLIEFLHLIQDHYGCLSAAHLRALAEDMRLSQVEVYEVATFYDHFDIVKEGEARPAPLTIRVCESISCMLAGAERLFGELAGDADPQTIRVMRAPCMGRCATAPAARVGDREVDHATSHKLLAMARDGDISTAAPDYVGLDAYRAAGGYQLLQKVRDGVLTTNAI